MSSNDVAIAARGLSKSYSIAHNAANHTTLGEALTHRLKNPLQRAERETFWALKDIDFDIEKGDVVGIIGRNGAGKSTLLKILSQITEPTGGEVRVFGRVGSLLEVGTGFHPELTGRENIFLNGAILGLRRKEIQNQFDAIVEFAGVEQFLDTPVKRYSSGMYVRLAFAVAAHLSSDILVVDEVLAVGDMDFQTKCLDKMQDVAHSGRTVLFVSHQMQSIATLCKQVMLLGGGKIVYYGDVTNGITQYMNSFKSTNLIDQENYRRKGTGELRYTSVKTSKEAFTPDEDKVIDFSIERIKSFSGKYSVSCHVVDEKGVIVLHLDSRLVGYWVMANDSYSGQISIKTPWLKPGDYRIDCYIVSEGIIDEIESACLLRVMPVLPYPATSEPLAGMYGTVLADFSYS